MGEYIIYKHTNKINGKVYIGQTRMKPSERFKNGLGYRTQIFYRAIQKYGWDNFEHEVLFENLTQDEANELEIQMIAEYQSNNPEYGYNISSGGNHREMSEEGRRSYHEKRLGHEVSEETRAILREKCRGRHHTEEERKKISKKNTGKKWFNNGIENVFRFECPEGFVEGMLPLSDKTKQNIGKAFQELKWFNDGETEIRAKECPDGFVVGRLNSITYVTSQKSCKKVICLNTGITYNSIAETAREMNLDKSCISYCCRGKYKQYKGYQFAFVEKEVS